MDRAKLDGIATRLRDALRQVEAMADPVRTTGPDGESVIDFGPGRRLEAFHGERPGPLALVIRWSGIGWTRDEAAALHRWLGEQLARAESASDARMAGQRDQADQ